MHTWEPTFFQREGGNTPLNSSGGGDKPIFSGEKWDFCGSKRKATQGRFFYKMEVISSLKNHNKEIKFSKKIAFFPFLARIFRRSFIFGSRGGDRLCTGCPKSFFAPALYLMLDHPRMQALSPFVPCGKKRA